SGTTQPAGGVYRCRYTSRCRHVQAGNVGKGDLRNMDAAERRYQGIDGTDDVADGGLDVADGGLDGAELGRQDAAETGHSGLDRADGTGPGGLDVAGDG